MYAKNEVSRYKTKKKTIWDCTLPLIHTYTQKKVNPKENNILYTFYELA